METGIGVDRDWRRYERDWKCYECYRRDDVNVFLAKAKSLIESNPPPWTHGKIGQPPYPPKPIVILLLLKTRLGMDYRSISAYPRALSEQRTKLGLGKAPSHTTIRNHMLRIPEAHLRRLNTQLTKPYQKGAVPPTAQATASTDTRHG